MTPQHNETTDVSAQAPAHAEMLGLIEHGLFADRPSLPAMLHYDERGSDLFEEICEQPEYSITRTETEIMRSHIGSIADAIGPGTAVVEPGSGASLKTEILLGGLESCAAYVPIDISDAMLQLAADRVNERFPEIPVIGVHADFTKPVSFPDEADLGRRRLVYFPGSTLGNFDAATQRDVLRSFREDAGPDGMLLLGVDLVKPVADLEAAYNDLAGVTAEFNFNVIDRLRDESGFTIDRDWFRFEARWDADRQAIVSWLIAERDATVIGPNGQELALTAGNAIHMEESHKYSDARIEPLAESAGLRVHRRWSDPAESFGVYLLTVAD